ncbi:hypothetical protein [Streptomyces sp. NPDC096153]|uniref:hypothetical protein n=1 Tax=Streptomyces sp. NPDC096153 TaxID=3155548 RepID=UPI00331BEA09
MDVSTFCALFAATCFTLVGLWWNVVQGHDDWMRRRARAASSAASTSPSCCRR